MSPDFRPSVLPPFLSRPHLQYCSYVDYIQGPTTHSFNKYLLNGYRNPGLLATPCGASNLSGVKTGQETMEPNGRQEGGMQKDHLIELRKFAAVLPEMSLGGKKVKCIPGEGTTWMKTWL